MLEFVPAYDMERQPLPPPGRWTADAACARVGFTDSWTPDRRPADEELAVVTAVCAHCPVIEDCASYARKWPVFGVWAGEWHDDLRAALPASERDNVHAIR
jgi:hypothetical protein